MCVPECIHDHTVCTNASVRTQAHTHTPEIMHARTALYYVTSYASTHTYLSACMYVSVWKTKRKRKERDRGRKKEKDTFNSLRH